MAQPYISLLDRMNAQGAQNVEMMRQAQAMKLADLQYQQAQEQMNREKSLRDILQKAALEATNQPNTAELSRIGGQIKDINKYGPPTEQGMKTIGDLYNQAETLPKMFDIRKYANTLMQNPETLEYGMKLSQPGQKEGFTLGENQVRYGPGGEVIARGPGKQQKYNIRPVSLGGGAWQDFVHDEEGNKIKPFGAPYSKRPEASEINASSKVVQKGEEKYAEQRLKDEAAQMEAMGKSAETAFKQNQSLRRFLSASKGGAVGSIAPIITGVQEFITSFGLYDGEMLKDTNQMQQAIADMKANYMKELGARGLTDKDMKILGESLPQVNTSIKARENVAKILIKINNRTMDEYHNIRQEERKNYPELSGKIMDRLWYKAYKMQNKARLDADRAMAGEE